MGRAKHLMTHSFAGPTSVRWYDISTDAALAYDGDIVEISGWMMPLDPFTERVDYVLLSADEACCGGCVSRDPLQCIEVLADPENTLAVETGSVTLRGRLQRLYDDPAGWRYQLSEAIRVADVADSAAENDATRSVRLGRRGFLMSGAAFGLAACAPGRFANYTESGTGTSSSAQTASPMPIGDEPVAALTPWRATPAAITLDMHSHAGRVIVSRNPAIGENRPFMPLHAPMRAGGMNVICLAIVTDTNVTRVSADRKRFEAWRPAQPGELYALSQIEFARAQEIITRERLLVVTDTGTLKANALAGPCVIIAAEGADFLEGQIDRVDEAYRLHQLRHLQLTHYRVNELGDIQTVPPVHGGLTDFGADVVRRCNTLGIVVDVAHGTFDLVKRAAATTSKPLVLSHTALATHPRPLSRSITADHARVIAETGGVIGVWPSSGSFKDLRGMAHGMLRMADVVGVDHVGLGSDMLGFINPPVFHRYEQLPTLGAEMRAAGFSQKETEQILGGNYRRVFDATMV